MRRIVAGLAVLLVGIVTPGCGVVVAPATTPTSTATMRSGIVAHTPTVTAAVATMHAVRTMRVRTGLPDGRLNIRGGPGMGYAVIGWLEEGTSVRVDECTDGWCHLSDGSGWVAEAYLEDVP